MLLLRLSLASCIIFCLACSNGKGDLSQKIAEKQSNDTLRITDTIWLKDTIYIRADPNWQKYFGLSHNPHQDSVWGKSVDHYISDPECDALAFDFYYGNFKPGDNALTYEMLELVLTPNDKLRPFYRWCLEKTMSIADGALGEYPGEPARKYAENYPKEFIDYMNGQTDSSVYFTWVELISFGGLDEFNYDQERSYAEIVKRMLDACPSCADKDIEWIEQFATAISSHEL